MQASRAGGADCYLEAGEPGSRFREHKKPVSGDGGAGFHGYINAWRSAVHGKLSPEESTD